MDCKTKLMQWMIFMGIYPKREIQNFTCDNEIYKILHAPIIICRFSLNFHLIVANIVYVQR